MSDLLAEADEALRQERMQKFFAEHGKMLIAFVILTIVMTGAISAYKSWNNAQQEKSTSALITLLNDAEFPNNIKDAELNMRPALRGMALLSGAGALLGEDKAQDALALYQRAASDTKIPGDFRQLATIMATRLDENADASGLEALESIWNDKKSPWRYHARLESAAILANQNGDFAGAIEHLNIIQKDAQLPDTLYKKAQALSHIYTLKQQDQQDKQNQEGTKNDTAP